MEKPNHEDLLEAIQRNWSDMRPVDGADARRAAEAAISGIPKETLENLNLCILAADTFLAGRADQADPDIDYEEYTASLCAELTEYLNSKND